jgi:hypothetical protein
VHARIVDPGTLAAATATSDLGERAMDRILARRLATMLLAAACAATAPACLAVAIVSNASLSVNFTDFAFETTEGERVDSATIGVTYDAGFVRLDRVEQGAGMADATGDAAACNLEDCGIISIFPLAVELDATSGAAGRGEVRGRSTGSLTFVNETGTDLVFRFFLESDAAWDGLSVDSALTEVASLLVEVRFEYTNGGSTVALSETLLGDDDGLSVDDVCPPAEESVCFFREDYTGFSLPDGSTHTLTGIGELFGIAASERRVAEPGTLWLMLASLGLLGLRRGRRPA